MVYGYQCGIHSSRRLEEACRYRIDFRWLLEDQPTPDHTTLARFRTGRCVQAAEDLFYQYARLLEEQGETDHETVFIDGTKMESRAGRYTFRWRKTVEKQLDKVKQRVKETTGLETLEALEQYVGRARQGSFLSTERDGGKVRRSGSGKRRTNGAGAGKAMNGICPLWEADAAAIPQPTRTRHSCA